MNKISRTYLVASILFYLAAVLNLIGGGSRAMSVIWLVLGSVSLVGMSMAKRQNAPAEPEERAAEDKSDEEVNEEDEYDEVAERESGDESDEDDAEEDAFDSDSEEETESDDDAEDDTDEASDDDELSREDDEEHTEA
jgi:cytoskeletal protein RodZ